MTPFTKREKPAKWKYAPYLTESVWDRLLREEYERQERIDAALKAGKSGESITTTYPPHNWIVAINLYRMGMSQLFLNGFLNMDCRRLKITNPDVWLKKYEELGRDDKLFWEFVYKEWQ